MKWIAAIAGAAALVFFVRSELGKTFLKTIKGMAGELREFKHYLGNIAGDLKDKKLQYGEDPEPVASRS
jgi:hypothetical protein